MMRAGAGTDGCPGVGEGIDGKREHPRSIVFTASYCQRKPLGCGIWRMQSLLRTVGRSAGFCRRRSLFSAFSRVRSPQVGSDLLHASGRWPAASPRSPDPLSASTRRACSSIAHMSFSTSHPEYRLPLNAKPTHYDLTIRTNLENQTFDGFVDVQ